MPIMKYNISLPCTPQEAYDKITDLEFIKTIDPSAPFEVSYLCQTKRFCKYLLRIKGVGEWQSQKIFIPESLTAISQRCSPMNPFDFLFVIQTFESRDGKTDYVYKEEFQINAKNDNITDKICDGIKKSADRNMKNIFTYFSSVI